MRQLVQYFPPLKTARCLFYLNAVIWGALAIASLIHYGDRARSNQPSTMLLICVLMFGNVAALLISAWGLERRQRWLYAWALGVVVVNIMLCFADQGGGILAPITLVINVVLLAILLADRSHYL